ncbi:MAG: hypothetical protein DIZ77_09440 [endosymbiont of Seepiophila jonesi]|uniref:Late embryogenesis abundant protein n=1 Tax=endosymbiont of Lamellibrachia luymesi TaxID=2200907 RepID=A0A370DPQ3_9GAMM|nr:MAG: hypothetical protein DIZ79_15800 [endosymbiont of Lamellibrachia luymesi]RDH92053.1 MAG: hypothetical protein DIZ77_09440 [endosymbiont of Seepiophila jonesi]
MKLLHSALPLAFTLALTACGESNTPAPVAPKQRAISTSNEPAQAPRVEVAEAPVSATDPSLTDQAKTVGKETWEKTKEVSTDTYDAVAEKSKEIYESTKDTAGEVGGTIKEKSGEYYDAAKETAGDIGSSIGEKSSEYYDAAKAKGMEMMGGAEEKAE